MKQGIFEITENREIAKDVFRMVLKGESSMMSAPGQFVNIKISGTYLRRPISVCDYDEKTITIIYKVVGEGTLIMKNMVCGEKLDLLTDLGNGFDVKNAGDKPLLIGGGVGVSPMYKLAKELRALKKDVTVVVGFNTKSDIYYTDEFEKLGCKVLVTTADGSVGTKGFVTDVLSDLKYSYFYTCGPEPMLKAVYKATSGSGELSFEKRMGCGFGACMGCTCKTITGYKRICKDGPVFRKEEILWED